MSRLSHYLRCQAIVLLSLLGALALILLLQASQFVAVGRSVSYPALLTFGAMVLAGFLLSYRLRLSWRDHFWVMAPWLVVLYLLMAFAMGVVTPDSTFMGWYLLVVAVVLLPWLVGALLGNGLRHSRR